MELVNHMEMVESSNLTSKYGEGRGIVYVAGNADTLRRVKWALTMLRSYGCQLPVQIVSSTRIYPNRTLTAVSLSLRSAGPR
jgi:hypothetical protein